MRDMTRCFFQALLLTLGMMFLLTPAPAQAQSRGKKAQAVAAPTGTLELGKFGDWGAYMAGQASSRVCFALSKTRDRAPRNLAPNDPGYIFISTRPAQNVRNELSFLMGYPLKSGGDATAAVDGKSFALESKDKNAFIKNAAEEGRVLEAMRGGERLVVKATSGKGNVVTDSYSLNGLGKALEKLTTDCK